MINNLKRQHVLKALDFIEQNLRNSISVDSVCEQIPLSQWEFQRVFRSLVGDSIGSYIRGRRLTEAFAMILQSEKHKLVDLAFEFQFNSHEAFTRSFKSYFGFTPKDAADNPGAYQLKRKPALDKGVMSSLWDSIHHEPDFKSHQALDVAGLIREVPSPFSEEDDFENGTILAWRDFHQAARSACRNDWNSTLCYGVALNTKDQLISKTMTYLASKSESDFQEIPDDLISFQIPQGLYAVFAITGSPRQIQSLVDYIYGIWLPGSGFQRSNSYDFEIFDFSQQTVSGQIVYQYNLPVQKSV